MRYELALLIFSIIFSINSAEDIQIFASVEYINNLKLHKLSSDSIKVLNKYLQLQVDAQNIALKKRELESQITQKLYNKQKIILDDYTKKYFEFKKMAAQLYSQASEKTQKRINRIMTDCLNQNNELCNDQLIKILNCIKDL